MIVAYFLPIVGEDEEVSIKEVTDAIVKALKFEGEYSFDTTRADGQFRKPASNKKLLELMGGFEFTPFEQGMRAVCATVCDCLLFSRSQLWTRVYSGFCRTTRQRGPGRTSPLRKLSCYNSRFVSALRIQR